MVAHAHESRPPPVIIRFLTCWLSRHGFALPASCDSENNPSEWTFGRRRLSPTLNLLRTLVLRANECVWEWNLKSVLRAKQTINKLFILLSNIGTQNEEAKNETVPSSREETQHHFAYTQKPKRFLESLFWNFSLWESLGRIAHAQFSVDVGTQQPVRVAAADCYLRFTCSSDGRPAIAGWNAQ